MCQCHAHAGGRGSESPNTHLIGQDSRPAGPTCGATADRHRCRWVGQLELYGPARPAGPRGSGADPPRGVVRTDCRMYPETN